MSIPLIYQEDTTETFLVKRTERIYISYDNPYVDTYSYFCHLSKNVWNQSQHIVEKEYKEFGHVPSYEDVDKMLNDRKYYENSDFDNYHKLGAKSSQKTVDIHNKSWKSYLVSIADYCRNLKKNNIDQKDYTGEPKEPKYKKKDGEFIIIFTNQQCKIKNGYLIFPKKLMGYDFENKKWLRFPKIKVRLDNNIKLDEVRIIPQGVGCIIEIVYDKEVIKDNSKYELDKDIIMAIDLGVENLGAITDNIGNRPIIIKSGEIKCTNQWYNKRSSELKSIYDRNTIGKACLVKIDKKEKKVRKSLDKFGRIKYLKMSSGHRLDIITDNRNKKVMDELHKFSRGIVKYALSVKAGIITIGKNPGWKQKIKMGKKNNQNFVNIPFAKLIDLVRYKAEEFGIVVLSPTEEYTSKCSFLDSEEICRHDKYMGIRGKKYPKGKGKVPEGWLGRGLFKASKGTKINSDVQGSYNILVKTPTKTKTKFDNVFPKFNVFDIIEGVVVHGLVPKRLSVSDLLNINSIC